MPIVNALPNTITNGQLVDAVPVMANFNWLVSQVNGNACPATSGSGVLKGNGTGGTSTAVAGTDYAGIGSANTFTALQSGIAATSAANFPIASQVQQSAFNTGASGGTADAITVTFTPTITSLTSAPIWWRATAANATTTPTLKRDGLVAKTLVKGANQALVAGDIPGAGAWMCSQYDATLDKEVLLNPAYAVSVIVYSPPGMVAPFAMNSAPTGWLAADGSVVSQTTYSALFAAISTTYNTGGEGAGNFRLPDLRGYFVRGYGTNSDGKVSGAFGAKQVPTAISDQTNNNGSISITNPDSSTSYSQGYAAGTLTGSLTANMNTTRPANIAMLYCIKT